MCGIAGIINPNQSDIGNDISKMLKVTLHRGPDQQNVNISDNYAFGVNRLSIEAISSGHQPIENDDYIIGFNGEIFNYKSLIEKFSLDKKKFNSEVKVLLWVFQNHKKNFVELIDGQFAIFIFEKRMQKLYLFRDRFGIRPIFYHSDNQKFYFCSEMKGIIEVCKRSFKISEKAIAQTCLFWTCIGEQTAFKDILQIPPGHYLVWSNGKTQLSKYKKSFFNNQSQIHFSIIERLDAAISKQIHGEVKIGAYLSGGVDSVALVKILKDKLNYNLKTYSIKFTDDEYDETQWQNEAVNLFKTEHKSIIVDSKLISDNFYKTIWHSESLLFRTAPVPLFLLSKVVKNDNIKVIMTGEGADEILLGYDLFFESRIRRFWKKDPKSKFRFLLLKKLYSYLPQFKNSRYFELIKDFYRTHLEIDNPIFYSHLVRWAQFKQVSSYFNLSKDYSPESLLEEILPLICDNISLVDFDEKAQIIEFETLLSNYLLNSQGDRMTMANSVEGRYPYLDNNFVDYMSKINGRKKSVGVRTKSQFRKELEKILPKSIANRPKIAYQAPEARAFFYNNKFSKSAEELADNYDNIDLINKNAFISLEKKIVNEFSSKRLGFRENMAYIMAQSIVGLNKI